MKLMKTTVQFLLGCSLFCTALQAQTVMKLYDKVPNSKSSDTKEITYVRKTDGVVFISQVIEPTITIYKSDKKNSTAVIVCPGGAYARLAINKEGRDVAKLLNKWGITAIVLKYRLPDKELLSDKTMPPFQDAQRAIQLARQHATEWDINPNKIGIMGFSAGGHLAATASTHFDKAVIDNPDNISLRPDFSVLVYPLISFSKEITGNLDNFTVKNENPDLVRFYSTELWVTPKTPPAFLIQASDDNLVKPANSIAYYEALLKNNISAELHIYQKGGHGFGLNNTTTKDIWTDRLKNWMLANNFVD